MIEFDDNVYEEHGVQGLLKQLAGHVLLLILGVLVLALPCYLIFLVLLESE